MSDIKLSKRYAKSLFDFSKEKNMLSVLFQEIISLEEILSENKGVLQFLVNPMFEMGSKRNLINSIFKEFSLETRNFLILLLNKGRIDLLREVISQFINLNNIESDNNILNLTIAEDLPDNLINEIIEKGKKILNFTGLKIEVKKNIDPSIVGGFILQIKDKQLNASVKNRLVDLKNYFNLNLYESKL